LEQRRRGTSCPENTLNTFYKLFWNKDAGASCPENRINIFFKLCFGTCPENRINNFINYALEKRRRGFMPREYNKYIL